VVANEQKIMEFIFEKEKTFASTIKIGNCIVVNSAEKALAN